MDMYSWLDLRRLRYLAAIVEHGSFSEAARALHVAQPALTHHLREMEKGYGATLLIRSHKGVTMTPAGKVLFACAKDILVRLKQADAALAELKSNHRPETQLLRVSVISSLSSALTPRLLSETAREMPFVSIHIFEKSAQESHELISDGKLDIAITLDYEEWKNVELLTDEELFFVSTPSNNASDRQAILLKELVEHRLILPSIDHSILRLDLEALAQKNGLPLTTTLEIDGLSPRKEAVLAGLGATILPIVSVAAEVAAGILIARRFDPAMMRRIVMKLRQGMDPATASAFKSILVPILKDVTRCP